MCLFLLTLFLSTSVAAQSQSSKVWVADQGDGTYRNPIPHADFSDPDVVRVGDDFYLVASSLPLPKDAKNFWDVPNLLLQKFPAPSFAATTKVIFTPLNDGERTGLIVTGLDYAYLSVEKKSDGLYISQTVCQNADQGSRETQTAGLKLDVNTVWLRVRVEEDGVCNFSFSVNGKTYVPVGQQFRARQGK